MKKILERIFTSAALCVAASIFSACPVDASRPTPTEADVPITVPVAGNAYHTSGPSVEIPTAAGKGFALRHPSSVVTAYFRVGAAGTLNLGLAGSGGGEVTVSVGGDERKIALDGGQESFHPVGAFEVEAPGYVAVSLSGATRADISALKTGGPATAGTNNFCTVEHLAEAGNWAYWARRGPSVHMHYDIGQNVEYFYNEITVTEGNDVVGSYYMTNGFGEGYCGFQVNSATERRILFSVWSPFSTDDPGQIPADLRVTLVRRGEGVTVNDFGNEGSGGQSYLVYPWKTGATYKVLTQVRHHGASTSAEYPCLTEYTAYFFDPERDVWRLIAAWRRPNKTRVAYTGAHSFLENFSPAQGWITREVHFGNQWVCTLDGQWTEVTHGRFTYDNTARQGLRADYCGGLDGGRFVLKNCGFFDADIPYDKAFVRPANGPSARPQIDLEALKAL